MAKASAVGAIDSKSEKDWQAESDLRAIQQANECRKDGERMRRVIKLANEQKKALDQVAGKAKKE